MLIPRHKEADFFAFENGNHWVKANLCTDFVYSKKMKHLGYIFRHVMHELWMTHNSRLHNSFGCLEAKVLVGRSPPTCVKLLSP